MHHGTFCKGDLVLVCNTRIEKELNRETKSQYLGPFIVEQQIKGGSYVLKEMNGVLSKYGVAAFRLVPYISRDSSILPSLADPLKDNEEELSPPSANIFSEGEVEPISESG
jgi:hypothetical protein